MNNDDQNLAALLNTLPVPEHRQGFWDDLNTQLATGTGPGTAGLNVVTDSEPPETFDNGNGEKRRTWWAVVALAAAAMIYPAVFGVRALIDDDPPAITEIITPTTIPAPVDEEPEIVTPTTAVVPVDEEPETEIIDISNSVSSVDTGGRLAVGVAESAGSIWVTTGMDRQLLRVDPAAGGIDAVIDMPTDVLGAPVAGDDAVWVMGMNVLYRVDPKTNSIVASIDDVGRGYVAASGDDVWVSSLANGEIEVIRIDAATNTIAATIPVATTLDGRGPAAGLIAIARDGTVYVDYNGTIHRIDPRTNTVTRSRELENTYEGGNPFVVGDAVWVVHGYQVDRTDLALETPAKGVWGPRSGPLSLAGLVDDDLLALGSDGLLYRLDNTSGELINTFDLGTGSNSFTRGWGHFLIESGGFLWIPAGEELWRVTLGEIDENDTTSSVDPPPGPTTTIPAPSFRAPIVDVSADVSDNTEGWSGQGDSVIKGGARWTAKGFNIVRTDLDTGDKTNLDIEFHSATSLIGGPTLLTTDDAVLVVYIGERFGGYSVDRRDPANGDFLSTSYLPGQVSYETTKFAVASDDLWLTANGQVRRIDLDTGEHLATIPLSLEPHQDPTLHGGDDTVWALGSNWLHRIDAATNTISPVEIPTWVGSIYNPVGSGVFQAGVAGYGRAAVVDGALLIAAHPWLYRVNTDTNTFDARIVLGEPPGLSEEGSAPTPNPYRLEVSGDTLKFGGHANQEPASVPLASVLAEVDNG